MIARGNRESMRFNWCLSGLSNKKQQTGKGKCSCHYAQAKCVRIIADLCEDTLNLYNRNPD